MVDTQKLKELKELLDSGALTQAEFDAAKQKLIDMPGAIGAVEMVPTSGDMLLTMQKPDGAKLGITWDWKGTNVVVVSVIPGSIAESTGVLVGDVLKMINGEAVSSPVDAAQKLVASGEIKLSIYRASAVSVAPIPAVPSGPLAMTIPIMKPDGAKLGITVDWKGTDVVVVSVIPGSITESTGVLVGDVVKMINGEAVSSPDDAVQKLVAASGEIKLDIVRVTKPPPPGAPPGGTLVHDKYCGPNTKRIAGCGPITSCIVYSSAGIAAAADPFGYAAAAGIITAIGTIAGVCCVVTPWIGCCPVDEREVYMLNGTKYRTTTGEKIERTC